MFSGFVKPVEIGRWRRLLLGIQADVWGGETVRALIFGEAPPEKPLFERILRSVARAPQKWHLNPFGITNFEDQIGIYACEGAERTLVAIDADKQISPPPYWRWMFHQLYLVHRDWTAATSASQIADRLEDA